MKLIPILALVVGLLVGGLWIRVGLPDCSDVKRGEGRYAEVCREALP